VITFSVSGSFQNSQRFLEAVSKIDIKSILVSCAQRGVSALASRTPEDTGRTAAAWGYEVSSSGGVYSITWTNSDIENGFPVAIMLQFGYGTGTGGYVQGRDYINPAIAPIFDMIADRVWKAVTSA
jgi:hypothetical protein